MLITRILLGTLMTVAIAALVALDAWLSIPPVGADAAAAPFWGWPTVAVVVALGFMGAMELTRMMRDARHEPVGWWAGAITVGLLMLPRLAHLQERSGTLVGPLAGEDIGVTVLWITGGLLGTCLAVLARKRTTGAVPAMAETLLVFTYLGGLGAFLVRIRCLDAGPAGAVLLLYTVLTVKACDIGAYLVGGKLGRTPLAPWVSPGKTTEGLAGGLVLACTVSAGFWLAWERVGGDMLGDPPGTVTQALLFGVVMAVIGHLGDMVESALKRDLGVKDSSRALPAFGGVLDIVDSPWFAAPAAWWLLTMFTQVR
jgi:phosphatidate cytidylyltransferase